MDVKTFEIRDEATFIPVVAVCCCDPNEADQYLLDRAGYGFPFDQLVFVSKISGGFCQMQFEPHDWNSNTMTVAHKHIIDMWETLNSGDVIDVEFLLDKTEVAKTSERHG